MSTVTTTDGTEIFYKDWGSGQPVVFSPGWPLSADDWDAQMMFLVRHGYRVIARDRRGHGRSAQASEGNDMNQGVEPSEAVIANWWRQGMMGGAKGQYECVSEFIREDYSADLEKITVPVLVMHGEADQIVPYATAAPRAAALLRNGTLKSYPGFPHGMPTTHADTINADLLAFLQS